MASKPEYIRTIKELRQKHLKTQEEIARVLGTSQTMYARYERGANEMPISHLITLAKYYSVSTDYILGLIENNNIDERKENR